MIDRIAIDPRPTLTQITIYPIKSLAGMIVDRSKISAGGALEFDRRWAIVDDSRSVSPQERLRQRGKVVNAKRTAKIHKLRSQFDLIESDRRLVIKLQTANDSNTYTFCLTSELNPLAKWLSEFLDDINRKIEKLT